MTDETKVPSDERLAEIVETIEALEEEKAQIASDIREKYAEAKIEGFDPKVLRQVIRLRKMEQAERDEQESLIQMYMQALGMYSGSQQ